MNLKLLSLACLAALSVAACKPEPPAAPVDVAAPAPVAAAEPVDALSTGAGSAESPQFDQKAFAGSFSGTLPCASCPGIDTRLELVADGTYRLDETYQGEKGEVFKLDGTWTAESNNRHLRLDPNSKSDEDRLYEIVSNEEIRMLGKDGTPTQSALDYSLKRDAATK